MADDQKPDAPRARRMVMDPEVQAMNDVSEILEGLSPPARARLLIWAAARCGFLLTTPPAQVQEAAGG